MLLIAEIKVVSHGVLTIGGVIAILLGSTIEYEISEVADRNAGIVLKLHKDRLRTLIPAK